MVFWYCHVGEYTGYMEVYGVCGSIGETETICGGGRSNTVRSLPPRGGIEPLYAEGGMFEAKVGNITLLADRCLEDSPNLPKGRCPADLPLGSVPRPRRPCTSLARRWLARLLAPPSRAGPSLAVARSPLARSLSRPHSLVRSLGRSPLARSPLSRSPLL